MAKNNETMGQTNETEFEKINFYSLVWRQTLFTLIFKYCTLPVINLGERFMCKLGTGPNRC